MTETPDFITENPDGSLIVAMSDGRSITMREPLVEDQLATKGTQEQREIAMMGNLCGLTPAEVAKLTSRNYRRLQTALSSFFD